MNSLRSGTGTRRGGGGVITLVVIVMLLVGGMWLTISSTDGDEGMSSGPAMYQVRMGDFIITVPTSGELIPLRQVEIASQLTRDAVITWIVDEGMHVMPGDTLITLDDELVKEEIKEERLKVEDAENALERYRNEFSIQQRERDSAIEQAQVAITLAEIAFRSWAEGQDPSKRKSYEVELEASQLDYDRLVKKHEKSTELLARDFISQDEYEQERISLLKAGNRLEVAELTLAVYIEYERTKQEKELQAEIDRLRDDHSVTEDRYANQIQSTIRHLELLQFNLDDATEDLTDAEEQLLNCTITAPQEALVVYRSSMSSSWRNEEDPPDIGTQLRRNRTVLILPDTSNMLAAVKVNESISGKIQPGQLAYIYSDALPDTVIEGEVLSVSVLAESGGWRDPNRRDYAVRIQLQDTTGFSLKPSMRCRADILVGEVEHVLHIPVQAVFRHGAISYVYKPEGDRYVRQEITLGRSSEFFIEVLAGLLEGDAVMVIEPSTTEVQGEIVRIAGGEPGGNGPA